MLDIASLQADASAAETTRTQREGHLQKIRGTIDRLSDDCKALGMLQEKADELAKKTQKARDSVSTLRNSDEAFENASVTLLGLLKKVGNDTVALDDHVLPKEFAKALLAVVVDTLKISLLQDKLAIDSVLLQNTLKALAESA